MNGGKRKEGMEEGARVRLGSHEESIEVTRGEVKSKLKRNNGRRWLGLYNIDGPSFLLNKHARPRARRQSGDRLERIFQRQCRTRTTK